jgi:hypothetical protein
MRGILSAIAGAVLAGYLAAAGAGAQSQPADGCNESVSDKLAELPLLSPEQAQADLSEIADELKKAHSGNEDYLTPAEFDEQVALAKARLARPVNAHQLSLVIMQLLNSTHDGHASLIEPRSVRSLLGSDPFLFPFNVRILDRRIYATADLTAERRLPAGSEILSIDDVPADQVLDRLTEFYTTDGYGKAGLYRSFEYEGWRPFRRSFAYIKGFPGRYTVGYRDHRTGRIGTISICAITAAQASERIAQQPNYGPSRDNDFPPKARLVTFSVRNGVGLLRIARLVEKDYDEPDSLFDAYYRDAFRKMRRFLMTAKNLTEDEAISLMSIAVDFGITQVVDGNWGVHAIIKKSLFAGA